MQTACAQDQTAALRPPLLHLHEVQRRFADRHRIHLNLSVDLHFDQAEVIGVFGANGAGKSTLMDLIAGHVAPTSGQVKVKGHRLNSIRREERKRLVRHHAQPHLAAPQAGRLPAMALWPRDWFSTAREAVQDLARKKAPAGGPQVFVFDEPPLEPPYGALLFDRFVNLRNQGNLVFFSAHPYEPWHLEAIRDVCDRYVFLEAGRLIVLDGFKAFMSHPGVVDYLGPLKFLRDTRGFENLPQRSEV